jgi:dipicolinate synthase subunit A
MADKDIIFNTVPALCIKRDMIENTKKNVVMIDLASAPGGIDHNAAAKLGLKSIWATALPGRCTPESAGVILADVMEELLSALA